MLGGLDALVNKPSDMVVHPAKGHWSGTLVNAISFHFSQLSEANGAYRAGIVHLRSLDSLERRYRNAGETTAGRLN